MSHIHPQAERLLRWFEYGHLPDHLQDIVVPSLGLAHEMANVIEEGPELTAGLRKLLEAKDCFVRAAIERDEQVKAEQEYCNICENFPCLGNHGLDRAREAVRAARGGDAPTQIQGYA